MKRAFIPIMLALLLSGCGEEGAMEEALAFRSGLLSASDVTFRCRVTADYIDTLESFTLDCQGDGAGVVRFTVAEPESIEGVTGTVSAREGALTFDSTVLAFPLLAEDRLSPLCAPWLLLDTLKQGCITSAGWEGELLRLTIDDSYADDALTMEIWLHGGIPIAGEIGWQGRRVLSMTVESWRSGA